MKKYLTPLLLSMFVLLPTQEASAQDKAVSGVYVGGHIRRERPGTITKLKESGFTYAILFNVHVDQDGTLKTDGETICKDGKYVFQQTQPHYVEDIRALKTAPTGISRLEICIGGWGNDSYVNIKNLVNREGTGENSTLYRNFKALMETVPGIDAVNNDDEHSYDVATATKFHVMMYDLGYKTTLAPYTNKTFWTSLAKNINRQRPGAVDRVMVQCYDGGAGNDPRSWTFPGITRHAGRTNYQTSMEGSIEQMERWRDQKAATGGFVWVYNDETWSLNAWASAMNRTFGARTVEEKDIAAKAYSKTKFDGYCVNLPVGTHTKADLALYGLQANDLESIQITEGYRARLYKSTDCSRTYRQASKSVTNLGSYWLNQVSSIVIEPVEDGIDQTESGLKVTQDHLYIDNAQGQTLEIFTLSGQKVLSCAITSSAHSLSLSSLPHGTYVVKAGHHTTRIVR